MLIGVSAYRFFVIFVVERCSPLWFGWPKV